MAKIVLVTGGARSGKSTFAEDYVGQLSDNVAYIATAVPFDAGMVDRIKKHVASRPAHWRTFEKFANVHEVIGEVARQSPVALLDCITVLVNNIMFENTDVDWDTISHERIDQIESNITQQIEKLVEAINKTELTCVIVTNELGMGIVPENRLARIYRDIAGRVNQYLGKHADEVHFVVSGIPMKIKGE